MHSPGRPVTFQTGLPQSHGEERNITRRNPDNNLIWAQVYEDFIHAHDPSHVLRPREVRVHLAKRWYRAARQLTTTGRPTEALQCYRRSCTWHPWNKSWLHLTVARFKKR
jgi:hypothetical protein